MLRLKYGLIKIGQIIDIILLEIKKHKYKHYGILLKSPVITLICKNLISFLIPITKLLSKNILISLTIGLAIKLFKEDLFWKKELNQLKTHLIAI
jgi:hypothetical protein